MKILSGDDNAENLYLIESMARAHGHVAFSATNGWQALECLRREAFDVIISDVLMPEMDGFQLCREVMNSEEFRQIPFVFYTATYTSKRDEEFGLSLGACRFLIKPLDPEQFIQVIADVTSEDHTRTLPSPELDLEYLKVHNERLVEKLGKKVSELQQTQANLRTQLEQKEREILRRRKVEEELAQSASLLRNANQDLMQFAYAAAHDLQEPLRNVAHILGMLQAEYADHLGEEAVSLIDSGIQGLRRMRDMVTDLLAFTRIADTAPEDSPAVDANTIAQEVMQSLSSIVQATGAEVTYHDLPAVSVQRMHLVQLFQNLISNGLKYAKRGEPPVIAIKWVRQGDDALFTVADHGIGFSPDYAQLIFGIFKRLHPSHEYEGTGIGLAICSRIVALYGGRMWAESELGMGAQFHFTLPLAD